MLFQINHAILIAPLFVRYSQQIFKILFCPETFISNVFINRFHIIFVFIRPLMAENFFLYFHFIVFVNIEELMDFTFFLNVLFFIDLFQADRWLFEIQRSYLLNGCMVLVSQNLDSCFKFLDCLDQWDIVEFSLKFELTSFESKLGGGKQVFFPFFSIAHTSEAN